MKRLIYFTIILFPFILSSEAINLAGWQLIQYNSVQTLVLPDTNLNEGEILIIGRDASKDSFEAFWGVALGEGVIYVNSNDKCPKLNGGESFALYDSIGMLIDSTYASQPTDGEMSIQRDSSNVNTWQILPASTATPGSFQEAGRGNAIVITEFTDSSGTGNFIYEFIEICNDSIILTSAGERTFIPDSEKYDADYCENSITIIYAGDRGEEVIVTLTDSAGRRLITKNVIFNGEKIEMKGVYLKCGVYFVSCRGEKDFRAKLTVIK